MARRIRQFNYETKQLGKYLKELRQDLGLSIREVARKTGFTSGYLSRIEAGQVFKSIGIETLVLLSRIYNISVSGILEEAGFIKENKEQLPEFGFYLRTKYKFSPQVIRDLELAKEIIEKKYSKVSLKWGLR